MKQTATNRSACRPPRSKRFARSGWTLIELVLMLGILGFVLSASATMMHSMFRAAQRTRHEITLTHTLARLSEQFRQDIHEATDVKTVTGDDKTSQLLITLSANQTIKYSLDQQLLKRIKRQGKQIKHNESFRLLPGSKVTFHTTAAPPNLATIVIERFETGIRDPAKTAVWKLEAAIGIDSTESDQP